MHAEDVSMGFKRRRVQITVKKPAVHDVTTLIDGKVTNVESLPSIMCDSCGAPIPDGSTAWAETMWRSSREGEPGNWEKEYQ
jgi:hypothetical protein